MNDSENPSNSKAKSASVSGVGALLKATRTRLGQDLKQVSQALRIRQLFLQAIEDGRFDELPGPTYALGFVRSYADFLGLDSEEVVRRFRAESSSLPGHAELVFPAPASEKRLPSGAVVAAALAVCAVVYGGWYAFTAVRHPVAEAVPETAVQAAKEGENQRAAKEAEPQPEQAAPVQPETPAAPAKPEEAKPEPPKVEPPKVDKVLEVKPAEPAPKVEEAVKKAEPPRIEPGKPGVLTQAPGLPPLPARAGMGGLSMTAAPAPASPAPEAAATAAPASPPQAAEASVPSDAPRTPKVYGQAEGEVRVVLKANSDSWIQVRDEKGNLVATRLLKKDDTYRVPSGMGRLLLTTGDAGALSASVDGVMLTPSLGPSGSVRRDIALDPERIKAGNQ